MSDTVIKVEDLSKLYRLGLVNRKTLHDDINRWWHRLRGKQDPYIEVGKENDRTMKASGDYMWALKDINFDVERGEVLGIIGRNGAGKSTLLKIISKVTAPTSGNIKVKGRIASLLEVGTGFHPDLTGRDNVFLNGAILGMTRKEIQKKFDEIVDFSGVQMYIDTPVKRYSSGMYVRLAFAVAAHLEPDILIVDEVLAVGDAEFQKKCLGKMKDVSVNDGRTVLFVSHNMIAVKNLCTKIVYMNNGKVKETGDSGSVINAYLSNNFNKSLVQTFEQDEAPGNDKIRLKRIEICPKLNEQFEPITVASPIDVEIEFWNFDHNRLINLSMSVNVFTSECVFVSGSDAENLSSGLHKAVCSIPANFLNDNMYSISVMFVADAATIIYNFENIVSFEVNEKRSESGWHGKWPGFVRPQLEWNFYQPSM